MNDIMKPVSAYDKTTLILNKAWLPLMVCSARVAINHMLTERMKAVSEGGGVFSSGEWFPAYSKVDLGIFMENQPALRSANNLWPIPTIGVTNAKFFYRPKNKRLSLPKLASYYNYRCQICGKKFKLKDLTIEHVFPRSKGGDNTVDNVLPTCKCCNTTKSDIHPYKDHNGTLLEDKIKKLPITLHLHDEEIREEWKTFLFKS